MGVHFTLFYVFIVAAPIVAGVLSTRIGTAGAAFDFGAFMLALCFRAYWVFDRLAPRATLADSSHLSTVSCRLLAFLRRAAQAESRQPELVNPGRATKVVGLVKVASVKYIRRRDLVSGLSAAATANLAWLQPASSQPEKIARIGIIDDELIWESTLLSPADQDYRIILPQSARDKPVPSC